jgi:hypothetical protein
MRATGGRCEGASIIVLAAIDDSPEACEGGGSESVAIAVGFRFRRSPRAVLGAAGCGLFRGWHTHIQGSLPRSYQTRLRLIRAAAPKLFGMNEKNKKRSVTDKGSSLSRPPAFHPLSGILGRETDETFISHGRFTRGGDFRTPKYLTPAHS